MAGGGGGDKGESFPQSRILIIMCLIADLWGRPIMRVGREPAAAILCVWEHERCCELLHRHGDAAVGSGWVSLSRAEARRSGGTNLVINSAFLNIISRWRI